MLLALIFVIAPNETTQMSCSWVWGQTNHSHYGILLWNVKKQNIDIHNLDGPEVYYDEWKSQSQQVTYCMTAFVYLINSWNEKNYKNEEQINGYQG